MELIVEYLVFAQTKFATCTDRKTFDHFIQSNSMFELNNNQLIYNGISFNYEVDTGTNGKPYFHVIIKHDHIKDIETFILLQKELKAHLYRLSDSPQILYDSISLHYAQLSYPQIFELENLMRKLITKFMVVNVGLGWEDDRIPDDVKKSIQNRTEESTFLYNLDFIKLKDMLFSENYPRHKEKILKKLKEGKDLRQITIEEIKSLLPTSNWDKFFVKEIDYSAEKLKKQWDILYDLRCKIAHNTTFTKADAETVDELSKTLKPILLQAINKLGNIVIPSDLQEDIKDNLEDSDIITSSSRFKQLLNTGLLKIGDTVVYEPALTQLGNKIDIDAISAEIKQDGSRCLQRKNGDDQLYSFSRLRGIMVSEFQLTGIRPEWGFGLWGEWILNGKKLSYLMKQSQKGMDAEK
jgi:hypothetical protein